MNREQARKVLIEALAMDYADTLRDDRHSREYVAEHGFTGYANMPDADLVQCAVDADLQDDDDELNEALEVLQ